MSQNELNGVFDDAEASGTPPQDRHAVPDASGPVVRLEAPRTISGNNPGHRSTAEASRGRLVGDRLASGPVSSGMKVSR